MTRQRPITASRWSAVAVTDLRGQSMTQTTAGASRRSVGWEFRTARWFVRHPGAVVGPGLLGASVVEFGPEVTGGVVGGLAVGAAAWYRANPDTFDAWAAPALRAWRRRWAGA